MRNIVIHDYANVDDEIIWKIIKENLPGVEPRLKEISKEMEEE